MAGWNDRLQEVLEGYATFLKEKELVLPKNQAYLVHWVREFLLFAREHRGYTLEQTLDLSLAEVGGRVGTEPWQLQQASDARRIYRCLAGAPKSRQGGRREAPTTADTPQTGAAAPCQAEHRDRVLQRVPGGDHPPVQRSLSTSGGRWLRGGHGGGLPPPLHGNAGIEQELAEVEEKAGQ